jgi:Tol biopolymer transport system component
VGVSPDCRWVAFDSEASDLLSTPVPAADRHVYRRDMQTGTTLLISRADGAGGALADQHAFSASISDDGDRVTFVTAASNLVGDDANGVLHWDLFVRDVSANDTIHASRSGTDQPMEAGTGVGFYPSISGDGTRVAFGSPGE